MDSKILWIDTETTGTDCTKHGVIQIAALFEINGEIKSEMNLFKNIHPHREEIDIEALLKNNRTIEEIKSFEDPYKVLLKFKNELGKYVNQYSKPDKFVMAGYNVSFDMDMMRASFERSGDSYFGSWFFWPVIDVKNEVAKRVAKGLRLPNYQLETLCAHFGVNIDAHDALSDIKATRTLYYKLEEDK